MPAYFSYLPDIFVGNETADERVDYKLVKNIFRRVQVDAALEKYSTEFEAYVIPEGTRPEMLAYDLFGDSELDWVILLTNNIHDIYDDWPKESHVLANYTEEKYGDWDGVHHWETREVRYNDAIFLQSGIEVNETFRVTLPNGIAYSKEQSIYPVSNIEHETYLNEQKRLIVIPNGNLLDFFLEDFSDLVSYQDCRELNEEGVKKTAISVVGKFLDRKEYRRSTSASASVSETVTSFDYGPTGGSTTSTAVGNTVTTTTVAPATVSTTSSTSSSSGSSGSSGY
ncbi:base plate wedge component [Synechococcus phage S-H35]|uniref:Base plate wedge component n=1 Tax=Synechococcus phage S-H35 TaxID=1983572 RepID=A0A1Z1LWA9_9CAUD|nr:baseplate wedge subunit [Synechococcus phage S-H35]ARW56953.1 base plate wedge component [Synechococcus phage S-H35]